MFDDPKLKNRLETLSAMSRRIPIDAADHPILQAGLAYWRGLCDGRKFPTRNDVSPRGLGTLIRNTALIRVIDGGADYEFRITGDAYVVAFGISLQGLRWSDLIGNGSIRTEQRRHFYEDAVRSGEPVAVTGMMESYGPDNRTIANSALFLPLGPDAQTVDHLLTFAVYGTES